jgi:hypothetical protein
MEQKRGTMNNRTTKDINLEYIGEEFASDIVAKKTGEYGSFFSRERFWAFEGFSIYELKSDNTVDAIYMKSTDVEEVVLTKNTRLNTFRLAHRSLLNKRVLSYRSDEDLQLTDLLFVREFDVRVRLKPTQNILCIPCKYEERHICLMFVDINKKVFERKNIKNLINELLRKLDCFNIHTISKELTWEEVLRDSFNLLKPRDQHTVKGLKV